MTHAHSRKRMAAVATTVAVAVALQLAALGPASAAPPTGDGGGTSGPPVAKSSTGSYIVLMQADPLLKSIAKQDLTGAKATSQRAAMKRAHSKVLQGAGVPASRQTTDFTNALNGFAVTVDQRAAAKLAKQPGVAAVIPDEMRYPQAVADQVQAAKEAPAAVANALNGFLGLTAKKGAYANGIDGRGTIVGVIDTGIWPEQPMFRNDPTLPAPKALEPVDGTTCAFGNTSWNADDTPFTCNRKIIGAREFLNTYKANTGLTKDEFDSARDNEGHGTHTASTAAGDANVQSVVFGVDKDIVSGIAPKAQIIAYKALGDAGGYSSDLSQAIDQAVADGVDVINYSIGGGARVVSSDTLSFLFAADAGIFAAVSAGNDGPGAKTVGGPANVPWVTAVGATTMPRNYAGSIHLGNGTVYHGTSITKGTGTAPIVDAARAGLPGKADPGLCLEGSLDTAKVAGAIVLCQRGQNGRVAKSSEVERAGGVGMVLFNAVDVDTMFSDDFSVPTVMIDRTPGEAIRSWVNSTAHPTAQLVNDGIDTLPMYSPTMTYFSSRGETVPNGDIIKPDISAPGAQIMAGNTPKPSDPSVPAGELWQAIAGTSMSSPVVAGTYALLKQAHPDWSAATAKSALMTQAYTGVRDNDRVSPATPFATGSGFARLGEPAAKGSAFQPGLVYDAGINDYLGFLCEDGRTAFGDAAKTCAALAAAGYPTTSADLNYPSIGIKAVPGTATVTRTVTNVSAKKISADAVIQAPAGYSVQVSPASLQVAPGESASFTVTVRNTGAAVGEWKFGSLTWKGSGYSVRSPIAVKGVAIHAPASITGSGTSGTATAGVTVGVSGAFTASAHGLVGTTHNVATVAQDPDQTFPSGDDGQGGVTKISFTLSGVDHARWKLQLPDPYDLDVYLVTGGKVVAQSTNGGTDEQIDLDHPADGVYTMYVHGWAVGATPVEFDLKSWLIPSTTGGSLSVTSGGSASVTPGTTVPVEVGWSGLTAGDDYLGTIGLGVDGKQLATTVVEVAG
ncbi:MAG TPA: S8 family serine peptidase [Microbacterium sp.]|uniref:S8 family serine peptidase n=1 Tax=Microbacterium sp. TaxID=51671 RepID=UPI002B4A4429|nr:S8 family serine peptidase [Microbacterium sp.]HKT55941.1 S8 family serine peptidase [Microbacterium sp.]